MSKREEEKRRQILARVEAMSHLLRVEITSILVREAPKSASEVAEELGEPVERVRYQLRQLVAAGVVEVAKVLRRRGTVEQFYAGKQGALTFETDELELVPMRERQKMAATYLRISFREALRSLTDSSTAQRPGTTTIRTPFRLDERGWKELSEIYRDAFDRVQKLRLESSKRLRGTEQDLISVTAVLLCFEIPPPA